MERDLEKEMLAVGFK